jgi:hypothetical protein
MAVIPSPAAQTPAIGTPPKPAGTAPMGLGRTSRRDPWWFSPGIQAVAFTLLAGYLFFSGIVWTPLFGTAYEVDGYLSPLFSPLIAPGWLPWFISPGLLILWIPLGFRATCYYYRKAYYRFYFADPPGCAVGEPTIHRSYAMETKFPFILQNIHRYFLYLAFIPLTFLWIDAVASLFPPSGGFRIGLGSVIFFVNVLLLSGFSFSCNSLRHLAGGRRDCFSCSRRARAEYTLWQRLTSLNRNHMAWAWVSFVSVVLADVYVRVLALGFITDPAIRL